MKESTATALMFGAAIFLTLALIGISVNVFSPATEAAKTGATDFNNTTTELKDQKYLIYENTTISGSQVLSALRKFEKEGKAQSLAVYVATGKTGGAAGVWYYSAFQGDVVSTSATQNLAATSNVTDNNYINPSGMFDSTVERDSNGVIRAIKFIQQNAQ